MHEDQQLYGRLDRIDEKLERLLVLEERQRRNDRTLEKHEGLIEGHSQRLRALELSQATDSTAAAGRWGFVSKLGWAVVGVALTIGGSLAVKAGAALVSVVAK